MQRIFSGGMLVLLVLVLSTGQASVGNAQDQRIAFSQLHGIEPYHIGSEVAGAVQVTGSGSVTALAQLWGENFQQFHQKFTLATTTGGSEKGLLSLSTTPGGMAAITRPLEPEDANLLQKAGVKQPKAILVGLDALAVFVHKDNPMKQINPGELLKIFTDASIKTWGQVGLTGEWANRPLVVQGRGSSSGTHTFIERYLLQGAPVRADTKVQESNRDMMASIAQEPGSICVSPLYLKTEASKALTIDFGGQLLEPTEATILRGAYPLVRPLMLVFDEAAPAASVSLNKQFLRFVLSREGQFDIVKAGFYPLNQGLIRQQQDALGIEIIR